MALHRNPENFTEPLRFAPERWSDATRDPSWKHDVRAFIPFTGGTFSCAGRALALLELRLFCARVLKRFNFVMPKDFDNDAFFAVVKSYQSLFKGALPLIVESRGPSPKILDIK
jgi:cytochrome P450